MRALVFLLAFWAAPALACGPDAPPAFVAAYGITCEVFNDDMTSPATFDVNDTRAPGFNWYVHNSWPNAANSGGCFGCIPTRKTDYTINGSGLTMDPVDNAYEKSMFMSCAATTANAAGYVGTVFSGSFYVRIVYTANYAHGGHIAWMTAMEYYQAGQSVPSGPEDEIDFFEDTPFSNSMLHEWSFVGGVATHITQYAAAQGNSPIGFLVVEPSRNGGTYGIVKRATNDIVYDTLQFGPTVTPIGQSGPTGDPIGTWRHLNTDHYCLMLSNYGPGSPYVVTSVKVWMAPPGNAVVGGARRGVFRR
jgi:hypothetical protein